MHTTSPTLLNRLHRPGDATAWQRLVELYTPLLFGWCHRQGVSAQDAADLVQEVFVALLQTLPTFQYDRSGSFRRWLRTLLLNKLCDHKRRAARANRALAQLPGAEEAPDIAEVFSEEEYRLQLARRALELMQARFAEATWKACWQTVVEGRSPADVAGELGISENSVYVARCRVLRRLRQDLDGLID
jgi:RNA polymerase sigma-70 factor (ECF subfamily)